MASMRDIKNRIRSVQSTKQITKAMELVSAAKVRRAKDRVEKTKPYIQTMVDTISQIVNGSSGIRHPFFEVRTHGQEAYVVITGSRGLCGGYNANLLKYAMGSIKQLEESIILTVGTKSKDFFKKITVDKVDQFTTIGENPTYEEATSISNYLISAFESQKIKSAYVVYTNFNSMVSQEPTIIPLLPFDKTTIRSKKNINEKVYFEFEPSDEEVLSYVIPKYICSCIYSAMLEAYASEQASRMTAMDNATINADEMIENLTLYYNRARQAAITQEISEIVGGAAAQET